MSNTGPETPDSDTPFAPVGFDLYGGGKKRRSLFGSRRVEPPRPAVLADETPAPAATGPMVEPETRSFVDTEARDLRREALNREVLARDIAAREAVQREREVDRAEAGEAMAESPLMGAAPIYATRSPRRTGGANRMVFPAVAILAVAAVGGWLLLTPSRTAPPEAAQPAQVATAPLAPLAPLPAPAPAVDPMTPVAATPTGAVNPPVPAPAAAPTQLAEARPAPAPRRTTTTTTRRTTVAAARPARSATESTADVSDRVAIPAPANPARVPAAEPAPPPMISAPPTVAPSETPAVTPPVDPIGAVNPPVQ